MLSHFVWDPDRVFFVVPYLNHPVMWYGLLFAIGFVGGYFVARSILKGFFVTEGWPVVEAETTALRLVDQGIVYIVIGALLGARLGHVFFYGWTYYQQHPWDIFKVWEGGLASHGGGIGILIALGLFMWFHRKGKDAVSFLMTLDVVTIPAAFAGCCIRIGNFINQEITGTPTSLPWGVAFLHPLDGVPGVVVHPVQLYEAFFYLLVFFFLFALWLRDRRTLGRGVVAGWFLVLVFGFRFMVEYLKMPQHETFDNNGWLKMGQLLSIPFILIGIALLTYARKKR
jgi:phosphatidylglycerol---prolipoprotein diacylglyceryl transferase